MREDKETFDEITDENFAEKCRQVNILRDNILVILHELPENSQNILRFRMGIEPFTRMHTLDETAKRFGESTTAITSIEAKALRMIMHPSRRKLVQPMDFLF